MEYREFWIKFKICDFESTHQIVDVSMNKLDNSIHVIEAGPVLEKIARLEAIVAAANKYIELSPCDYDIYPDQFAAWNEYKKALESK